MSLKQRRNERKQLKSITFESSSKVIEELGKSNKSQISPEEIQFSPI